jgi:hypothetical protein
MKHQQLVKNRLPHIRHITYRAGNFTVKSRNTKMKNCIRLYVYVTYKHFISMSCDYQLRHMLYTEYTKHEKPMFVQTFF